MDYEEVCERLETILKERQSRATENCNRADDEGDRLKQRYFMGKEVAYADARRVLRESLKS